MTLESVILYAGLNTRIRQEGKMEGYGDREDGDIDRT